eukprot:96399-Pleurochrysis_carterae.AAC.1
MNAELPVTTTDTCYAIFKCPESVPVRAATSRCCCSDINMSVPLISHIRSAAEQLRHTDTGNGGARRFARALLIHRRARPSSGTDRRSKPQDWLHANQGQLQKQKAHGAGQAVFECPKPVPARAATSHGRLQSSR